MNKYFVIMKEQNLKAIYCQKNYNSFCLIMQEGKVMQKAKPSTSEIISRTPKSSLTKILISFLAAQTLFSTTYEYEKTEVVEIPKEIREKTDIPQTHVEIKFRGREPVFGIKNIAEAGYDGGLADDELGGAETSGNSGIAGMWQSAAMGAAMGLIGGIPIGNNVKYTFSSTGAVQAYVICNTSNTNPEVGSEARLTCICHVAAAVGSCIPPVMTKSVQYTEGGNKSDDFKFATWKQNPGNPPTISWGAAQSAINAVVYDGSTSLAYDFGTGGSTWGDGGGINGGIDSGSTGKGLTEGGVDDSGYGNGGYYGTDPTSVESNGGTSTPASNPNGSNQETENNNGGIFGIDPTTIEISTGGINGIPPTETKDAENEHGGIISEGGDIKADMDYSSFGGGINDILNDNGNSFNAGDDDWTNSNSGLGDIGDYLDSVLSDNDIPSNMTSDLLGLDENFLNSVYDFLNNGEFDINGNPIGNFDDVNLYDENGNYIGDGLGSDGYYDEYGNYIGPGGYDENGNFVGAGGMYDENGNYVGPGGYDADGNFVGSDGLYDADGNYVGPGGYDENGNFVGEGGMFDANGNYIGIGGYDKDGRFVGKGGMYDKYGNYVGNKNDAFNANPNNPFALLQSMIGINESNANNGVFGDIENSSIANNNPLLKSLLGNDEKEIARNTASNQELFEKAFKFLKGLGLSNEDILKGRTYDPDSAWTDPKQAWDFNRITTLLRHHQVKLNEKTGGTQVKTPQMPKERISDTANVGQPLAPLKTQN